MKALVWKTDNTFELDANRPDTAPKPGEVVVRVEAAGVCSTDLHMVRGKLVFASPPWVLGHEIAGVVHATGEWVTEWKKGDRVVVDPVTGCGVCRACQTGKKYLCAGGGELGTTVDGGGYGEFVVVKAANLYRLPDRLSFVEGAMMEPLNCTLGAIDRVKGLPGARVAVFGAGPAGLLFMQLARTYGASSVTLIGLTEASLEHGRRLGADRVLLSDELERLADEAFDVTIEASGSLRGAEDCFNRVEAGGTVVLYGLNGAAQPNVRSDQIVAKDLHVVTCISAPLLWPKCIELVACGAIDAAGIVTATVAVEQAPERLTDLAAGRTSETKLMILHSRMD